VSTRTDSLRSDRLKSAIKAEEEVDEAERGRLARPIDLLFGTNLWILLILGVIVGFFGILNPSAFLSGINTRNITLDTAEIMLLVIGETFVLITAGVDLSVGSVLVFAAVIQAKVTIALAGTAQQVQFGEYPHQGLAIPVGIVAALAVAAGWGVLNGVLVAKLRIPPLIVTLGTMGMALGAANLLTGGVSVPNVPITLQTAIGAYDIWGWIPVPVAIAAVAVVVAILLLGRTRFGRYTYAVGSSAEASRRAGINVNLHLIKVYTLCGFLAGIAGVIDLSRFDTITPSTHALDNLNAIAAVAIGGTSLFGGIGSITGGVIGAFIPSVLQNGLVIENIEPYWQQVLVGGIIVAAVYVDQWRRRRNL